MTRPPPSTLELKRKAQQILKPIVSQMLIALLLYILQLLMLYHPNLFILIYGKRPAYAADPLLMIFIKLENERFGIAFAPAYQMLFSRS